MLDTFFNRIQVVSKRKYKEMNVGPEFTIDTKEEMKMMAYFIIRMASSEEQAE